MTRMSDLKTLEGLVALLAAEIRETLEIEEYDEKHQEKVLSCPDCIGRIEAAGDRVAEQIRKTRRPL
jgi:hypothetical protein